jgi:UPF0176 protein
MTESALPSCPTLPICVAAFYQFARLSDCAALRSPMLELCEAVGVKGTLLLAHEGINGTIAGSDEAIARVLAHLRTLPGCAELEVKYSRAPVLPFRRLKVRLKREIVTMGQPDVDPLRRAGHYVAPEDWNALIADPTTIVIDTRNDYEVAAGTFAGAINPQTRNFRDFPAWFRQQRANLLGKGTPSRIAPRRIAMFCTGGIRCEKSTNFLQSEGLDEVYHLKGGILNYLEKIPEEASLWQGECFVFDERVTVGHGLAPGNYVLCQPCGKPVSEAERTSPLYVEDLSCPACHGQSPGGDWH